MNSPIAVRADTQSSPASTVTIILTIIALAATYMIALDGQPAFRLDDAYIVLNNAEALGQTDTAFPNAAPLTGSTSLLHTLLVAGVGRVLPAEFGLLFLAWVALALFGVGAVRLAALSAGGPFTQMIFGLVAVFSGDMIRVHLNGLETGLVLALITWMVIAVTGRSSPAIAAVLLAIAPFLRPELALLSIALFCVLLARPFDIRDLMTIILIGGTVALLGLGLQTLLSGTPLPTTGSAKTAFFGSPTDNEAALRDIAFQRLQRFLREMGPLFLFVFAVRPSSKISLAVSAFGATLITVIILRYPSIMGSNYYRYLYFLFPIALVNASAWLTVGRMARSIVTVLLTLTLIQSASDQFKDWNKHVSEVAGKRHTMSAAASWINTNLDPEYTALIHDIGSISWGTDQKLFDFVGLRSPERH